MVNFLFHHKAKTAKQEVGAVQETIAAHRLWMQVIFTHSILHQRKQSDRMIPSCKSVNRELPVDRKKQFLRQKVNILEMETDATNLQSGEECDFHKHGRVKSIR